MKRSIRNILIITKNEFIGFIGQNIAIINHEQTSIILLYAIALLNIDLILKPNYEIFSC